MSTFLWITLVVLYLTALVSLGVATLRKGHTVAVLGRDHLPGPLDHRRTDAAHREGGRRTLQKHAAGVLTGARLDSCHDPPAPRRLALGQWRPEGAWASGAGLARIARGRPQATANVNDNESRMDLLMTPSDAPKLPRTEPEFRAERLGYALRSLAADLVDERHKVAELRREVAELRARLESLTEPHLGGNE